MLGWAGDGDELRLMWIVWRRSLSLSDGEERKEGNAKDVWIL
jgi:hypothetical protein